MHGLVSATLAHGLGRRLLTSASSLLHLPEERKLLHTVVATWLANSTVNEPVLAPPPIVTPLLLSSKTRDWWGRSQKEVSQAGSIRNNTTGPAEKVHSQPMHYTVQMMPEAYSNLVDLQLLYAAISVIYSKFNKGQALYECDW